MKKYTITELGLLSDILGVLLFKQMDSHNKKDKTLPTKLDGFISIQYGWNTFSELIENGYVHFKKSTDDSTYNIYGLTELGLELYKKQVSEMLVYKKPIERDLQYLRDRVNFYCDYFYYRFCDDNSKHVFDAYVRYFLHGHRMSHTTTDCVKHFLKELKTHDTELKELYTKYFQC